MAWRTCSPRRWGKRATSTPCPRDAAVRGRRAPLPSSAPARFGLGPTAIADFLEEQRKKQKMKAEQQGKAPRK